MRKIGIATLALVSAIGSGATAGAQSALNGNGAPSGALFNLSIIGVDKTADLTGGNGHVIFVQLNGGDSAGSLNGQPFDDISKTNKIFLLPAPAGESFQVLDANATDANGAQFQLPADVSTARTVSARPLGNPGGSLNMTTCATETVTDPTTGVTTQDVVCSVGADLLFMDVTADTTLAVCLGVTAGTTVTLPLFNSCLQNFFWNY
jgi:hypothetical protein